MPDGARAEFRLAGALTDSPARHLCDDRARVGCCRIFPGTRPDHDGEFWRFGWTAQPPLRQARIPEAAPAVIAASVADLKVRADPDSGVTPELVPADSFPPR